MTKRQRRAYQLWRRQSFRPANECMSDIDHAAAGTWLTTAPKKQHRAKAARDLVKGRKVRSLSIALFEDDQVVS